MHYYSNFMQFSSSRYYEYLTSSTQNFFNHSTTSLSTGSTQNTRPNMLIQLPPEVWMEILHWLRGYRREMAGKFNKLGNRHFSEICQHWLHKDTKNVQLGRMRMVIYGYGSYLFVDGKRAEFPSLEQPLPTNITGFKAIQLNYLNTQVLGFLGKLATLFTNVYLRIHSQKENLDTTQLALGHLLPLIDSMDAIMLPYDAVLLLTFIREQFSAKLFACRWLHLDFSWEEADDHTEFLLQWLCTQRHDGEPRVLVLENHNHKTTLDFVRAIREHFLRSTSSVSFFVRFMKMSTHLAAIQPEEEKLQNLGTGEQLIFRKMAAQGDGDEVIDKLMTKFWMRMSG